MMAKILRKVFMRGAPDVCFSTVYIFFRQKAKENTANKKPPRGAERKISEDAG